MKITEIKITTNSALYNKLRKQELSYTGRIRCSYCPYHRGENLSGYEGQNPSWKLTSKVSDQWRKKKISKINDKFWRTRYSKYISYM